MTKQQAEEKVKALWQEFNDEREIMQDYKGHPRAESMSREKMDLIRREVAHLVEVYGLFEEEE